MRRSFSFITLILLAYNLQASVQDSLLEIYPDQGRPYVDALNQIAYSLESEDPDSGYSILKMALQQAEKLNYYSGIARSCSNLGSYYVNVGLYDEAEAHFQRSIENCRLGNNSLRESSALNNMGIMYAKQGDFEASLKSFFASLEIIEELKDSANLGGKWMNIGAAYAAQNELDQAAKYFDMARKLAVHRKDTLQMGSTLQNLAGVMQHTGKPDSALVLYNEVLNIWSLVKDNISLASTHNNMGETYVVKKDYEQAMFHLQKARDISLEINNKNGISRYYLNIGSLWDKMGNKEKALENLHQGLALAKEVGRQTVVLQCYQKLSDVHEKYDEPKSALVYQKQAFQLRDSIFDKEKATYGRALNARYELGKKEATIVTLEDQNKSQQLTLNFQQVAIVVLIITLLALAFFAYFFIRFKNLRAQNNQKLLEQRLLRSQINPHFIFNSMNSIQSYLYQNDKDHVSEFLSRFAGLMRHILHSSREPFIPLDEEISSLRTYLEIQQLRFEESFDYEIHVDEDIEPDLVGIPPLFVQPFVENSIEHGIRSKGQMGKIIIRYLKNGDHIRVEIEDNGIGRKAAEKHKKQSNPDHQSVATLITRERLHLLFKKQRNKARLNITDVLDKVGKIAGTKVDFYLPFGQV